MFELIIIVIFLFVIIVWGSANSPRPRYRKRHYDSTPQYQPTSQEQMLEAAQQNAFSKRSLLNRSEKDLFYVLLKCLDMKQYKICPQTTLGEFLSSNDEEAFRAINSKRCDFLITDRNFIPVAAIEYHGSGHYQGDARIRDATKREAIESAGLKYIPLHVKEYKEVKNLLTLYELIEPKENVNRQ